MEVRHATMADLAAVTAVRAECFPAAEVATEASFRARLRVCSEQFWLLFDQEKLVGFVNGMVTDMADLCDEMYENVAIHDEAGTGRMIIGVNTIPGYRCRGLAEMVLRRMIDDARTRGPKGRC